MLKKTALIAFTLSLTLGFSATQIFASHIIVPRLPRRPIRIVSSPKPPSQSPSPKASPKPSVSPTPKASVQPTTNPTPLASPTNSVKAYILDQINIYRGQNGLAFVKTDPYTCDFAKIRAKEITTAFNHDGFNNRINNKTLPYPNYSLITENIAMTSNYKEVVNLWINSSAHAKNMRADTPFVCVEQSGNYYAYEGWKS